jgi:hypothetical protein
MGRKTFPRWGIPRFAFGILLLSVPLLDFDTVQSLIAEDVPIIVALAGLIGMWRLVVHLRPQCQSPFVGAPGAVLGILACWSIWPGHLGRGLVNAISFGALASIWLALGVHLVWTSLSSVWYTCRKLVRFIRMTLRNAFGVSRASETVTSDRSRVVRRYRKEMIDNDHRPPNYYVITLVHGTWAPDATWIQPGSKLRIRLEQHLGQKTVFSPYTWAGSNSYEARLRAGADLRQHLLQLCETHPDAEHYVVAHSHGGNVALYALRDAQLAQRISGVITMCTPFLTTRARKITPTMKLLGLIVPLCAIGVIFVTFAYTLFLILGSKSNWEFKRFVILVYGIPLIVIPIFEIVTWRIIRKFFNKVLPEWLRKKQKKIIRRLSLVDDARVDLLCGYVTFDEAGLAIDAAHRVGELFHISFEFLASLMRLGFASAMIMICVGMVLDWVHGSRSEVSSTVFSASWIALICIAFLSLGIQLANLFVPKVLRGYVFGQETWLDNLLVDIRPARCPIGRGLSVASLAVPVDSSGLRHSSIYTSRFFLDSIACWIKFGFTDAEVILPSGANPERAGVRPHTAVAFACVLLFWLSQVPSYRSLLYDADLSPQWEKRHPELVGHKTNSTIVRTGSMTVQMLDQVDTIFSVPNRPYCELSGVVRGKESDDRPTMILKYPTGEVVTYEDRNYWVVAAALSAAGQYTLSVSQPDLAIWHQHTIGVNLEAVCWDRKPGVPIAARPPGITPDPAMFFVF